VKDFLRGKVVAPIVIGGIHATMDPESLTSHFDLICHGEGEDLVSELARRTQEGRPPGDIPGLWIREGRSFVRNPAHELLRDLDDYPLPDYDLARQFILDGRRIVPMTQDHVERDFFVILGSRGCPHQCTYCSNRAIKERFPWRRRVRHYPVDPLLGHLKAAAQAFPRIRSFWIDDDTFFAKKREEIEEFSRRYALEVGKPFLVLISPWTFDEDKLRFLVEAGLCRLIMGIQSGSENTTRYTYDRNLTRSRLMEIARALHRYSEKMVVCYDFIGMNPFENEADLADTIRFIRDLPPPFFIYNNNLAFYPGTALYMRAVAEGIPVQDRVKHSEVELGYRILVREKIAHKLFHLLLLMMRGETRGSRVGLIPRIFLEERFLSRYTYLDNRFRRISNALASATAWGFLTLNWRRIVKAVFGADRVARLHATVLRSIGK